MFLPTFHRHETLEGVVTTKLVQVTYPVHLEFMLEICTVVTVGLPTFADGNKVAGGWYLDLMQQIATSI